MIWGGEVVEYYSSFLNYTSSFYTKTGNYSKYTNGAVEARRAAKTDGGVRFVCVGSGGTGLAVGGPGHWGECPRQTLEAHVAGGRAGNMETRGQTYQM